MPKFKGSTVTQALDMSSYRRLDVMGHLEEVEKPKSEASKRNKSGKKATFVDSDGSHSVATQATILDQEPLLKSQMSDTSLSAENQPTTPSNRGGAMMSSSTLLFDDNEDVLPSPGGERQLGKPKIKRRVKSSLRPKNNDMLADVASVIGRQSDFPSDRESASDSIHAHSFHEDIDLFQLRTSLTTNQESIGSKDTVLRKTTDPEATQSQTLVTTPRKKKIKIKRQPPPKQDHVSLTILEAEAPSRGIGSLFVSNDGEEALALTSNQY
jgi:hypothetical protein